MKRFLLPVLPLLFLSLAFCKGSYEHNAVRVPDGNSVILVGTASLDSLHSEPFDSWFEQNYRAAEPDPATVQAITPLLEGVEIHAFIGTWCEDSQREVPKFVKILEEARYPIEDVRLVTMTREKSTPQNYEEGLHVTNVPTFIFYKDGKELNRIVEFPIESLESDMLKILRGEPYKHAYVWD
ncbi:MAG: thioredoxin family protein [Robiginitalea sp.]|jgi:thiol-disulfide isomerase/thioredoxin